MVGSVVAVAVWVAGQAAGSSPGNLGLPDLVSVLAAASAALGAFVALALPLRAEPEPRTLDERIDDLAGSLRQASATVIAIEREISTRRSLAAELAAEAATHEKILATRREDAEAIAQLLRTELQESSRRARRDQVILGFVFFVLGSAVTVVVTIVFT